MALRDKFENVCADMSDTWVHRTDVQAIILCGAATEIYCEMSPTWCFWKNSFLKEIEKFGKRP